MDAAEGTLTANMEKQNHVTLAWIEAQYAASGGDPWGLDWRPTQKYRYAHMFGALQSALGVVRSPLAIVDVGCATGGFTAMMAGLNGDANGGLVVGVDIAESAIKRAAARFPNAKFECMALDECATKYAGVADVVTCMEVLYYLPAEQRGQAMRQLKSMLKPGGTLLVSSMVSSARYLSTNELHELASSELTIIDRGVLYLKPLAMYEKILMKLFGQTAHKGMHFSLAMVGRLGRCFGRLLPGFTRSHGYVIARNGE